MGLQGVQLQANFFIDKVGGVVEIGAWRRFCGQGMLSGSRYYVVARFGDSRALGKVLGPWEPGLDWGKKQAGLGRVTLLV